MLSNVSSTFHISDRYITRKYIRHALNLIFVLMDMYVLLIPCITFVVLYLSGIRVKLSLSFNLILLRCKYLIRLSSKILVTYGVSPCIFSRIGVVIPAAS